MRELKYVVILLLCALAASAHGQEKYTGSDYVTKSGCVLRAQAYVDKSRSRKALSLYALEIVRPPRDFYLWDFTLDTDPNFHYGGVHDAISPVPYGSKQQTTLHATLHQYDTCEERITFKNLEMHPLDLIEARRDPSDKRPWMEVPPRYEVMPDVGQKLNFDTDSRYLVLKKPVTATTPSGISITLPAQGAKTIRNVIAKFNGHYASLIIQINTLPNQREVLLPQSPLLKSMVCLCPLNCNVQICIRRTTPPKHSQSAGGTGKRQCA